MCFLIGKSNKSYKGNFGGNLFMKLGLTWDKNLFTKKDKVLTEKNSLSIAILCGNVWVKKCRDIYIWDT